MTNEKIAPSIAEVPSVEAEKAVAKEAKTRVIKGAKAAAVTRKMGSTKASAKTGKPTKKVVAKPVAAKAKAKVKVKVESKAKHVDIVEKGKKDKLVRDSFTMPATEYALLSELKKRCLTNGVAVKKSEVLRAALASLSAASDASVLKAINKLHIIKTGRPAKAKA
jgi:translation initiation factor 1 (eIF-1/SUI1)